MRTTCETGTGKIIQFKGVISGPKFQTTVARGKRKMCSLDFRFSIIPLDVKQCTNDLQTTDETCTRKMS